MALLGLSFCSFVFIRRWIFFVVIVVMVGRLFPLEKGNHTTLIFLMRMIDYSTQDGDENKAKHYLKDLDVVRQGWIS